MSHVATAASAGAFTGTGDVGATLLAGDSVTITLPAPADQEFVTTTHIERRLNREGRPAKWTYRSRLRR